MNWRPWAVVSSDRVQERSSSVGPGYNLPLFTVTSSQSLGKCWFLLEGVLWMGQYRSFLGWIKVKPCPTRNSQDGGGHHLGSIGHLGSDRLAGSPQGVHKICEMTHRLFFVNVHFSLGKGSVAFILQSVHNTKMVMKPALRGLFENR